MACEYAVFENFDNTGLVVIARKSSTVTDLTMRSDDPAWNPIVLRAERNGADFLE